DGLTWRTRKLAADVVEIDVQDADDTLIGLWDADALEKKTGPTLRPTARSSATTAPSKDRSSWSSTRRPRCWSEPSPTSSSTTTTSATTRASATSPPPMSTTAAGTRSWPKERRSQTGPYSNDGTTIGPAGSERRPPRCPLTKGPKSPKVADDVQDVDSSRFAQ